MEAEEVNDASAFVNMKTINNALVLSPGIIRAAANTMPEDGHASGRGRGRGSRGRGRGHGSRTVDQEMNSHAMYEEDSDVLKQNDKHTHGSESMENVSELEEVKQTVQVSKPAEVCIRNFDLNMNPDENMDSLESLTPVPSSSSAKSVSEEKHEEYPGWSWSDMEKMSLDPTQLANLNGKLDADKEDYDKEM